MVKEHRPIWESDEWKQVRERVKKDQCEWCSDNTVLVVQQTWKFPKFLQIKNKVFEILYSELQNKEEVEPFELSEELVRKATREVCPECQTKTINMRKYKKPQYRCSSGHEFENPNQIIDYTNKEVYLAQISWKKEIEEKYKDRLESMIEAEYTSLEQRYLSGKETITLCRSCSYHRKLGHVRCKICGKNFHSPQFESCYECNTVLCKKCGEKRILKKLSTSICKDCNNDQMTDICQVCTKNPVEPRLKICADCVLQGYWVD